MDNNEYIFFESVSDVRLFLQEVNSDNETILRLKRSDIDNQLKESVDGSRKINTILNKSVLDKKITIFDEYGEFIATGKVVGNVELNENALIMMKENNIDADMFTGVSIDLDEENTNETASIDMFLQTHASSKYDSTAMFETYVNNSNLKNSIFEDTNQNTKEEYDVLYNIHELITSIDNMGEGDKKTYIQSSLSKEGPLNIFSVNNNYYVTFDDDCKRVVSYDDSSNNIDIRALLSHGGFNSNTTATFYKYELESGMDMRSKFVILLNILSGGDEVDKLKKVKTGNLYKELFDNTTNIDVILKHNKYIQPYGDVRFDKINECFYLPKLL